ncbi:MAG: ABC transporter permease subunit [Phycisphaerae bacterium]|jgi:hypothetical protein|nr:ABC transporter permease subunit [Phycisphaerae bacterium]
MTKIWAICRTTFLQTIRQPIYGVLILVTFALMVGNLPLSGWTVGSDYHTTDQKMLENVGLSTLLVTGLLIAAFSAAGAIGREIEDKTTLTVISKPVGRAAFVLGKFVGLAAAVILAYYLCSLVFLLTVRHKVTPSAADQLDWPVIVLGASAFVLAILVAAVGNLVFAWTFTAAVVWSAAILLSAAVGIVAFVGKGWQIQPFAQDISPQLIGAMGLMLMAVTMFVAIAVAASTRLSQVMTLLVCCGIFFIGSMHHALFGSAARDIIVLRVLGAMLPNLANFYTLNALMQDKATPGLYFALAGGYCALYVTAALAVGIALFQTRPLEAQGSSTTMPHLVGLLAWTGRTAALAMGIAGGVLLSLPRFYTLADLSLVAALLVGAAAAWVLWGLFARGVRWVYWLAVAVAVVKLARCAAVSLVGPAADWARWPGEQNVHAVLQTIAMACVMLILVLPKTRRHFRSEGLQVNRLASS